MMGSKNANTKHSLEMEVTKEKKFLRISIPSLAKKSLESLNSGAEEKSCLRKCSSLILYNSQRTDVVEKAIDSCSQRENGSANQMDDNDSLKKCTRIDKSACVELEQKDEEGCVVPMSLSKVYKESKSLGHDLAFDIREELLPGKTNQDIQVMEKEWTEVLIDQEARGEEVPEKDRKKKSSHQVARKKELREFLKARMAELKQETTVLSRELQRHSTMCMQLTEDNNLLMAELKKMCEPRVIEILEAKDPAKNPAKNHQ